MAWTEQCRIAFKANADAILWRLPEKERNVKKTIAQISEESGIPVSTLEKWYYEKSYSENGVTTKAPEQEKAKEQEWPTCSKCNHRPVEQAYRKNEPHKSGLCHSCRRKQSQQTKDDAASKAFEETPVDLEAERDWNKIADEVDKLLTNSTTGKVSHETLMRVNDVYTTFGTLWRYLFEASTLNNGG